MYRHLERRLAQKLLECLHQRHPGVSLPTIVIEQPPKVELGGLWLSPEPHRRPLHERQHVLRAAPAGGREPELAGDL